MWVYIWCSKVLSRKIPMIINIIDYHFRSIQCISFVMISVVNDKIEYKLFRKKKFSDF